MGRSMCTRGQDTHRRAAYVSYIETVFKSVVSSGNRAACHKHWAGTGCTNSACIPAPHLLLPPQLPPAIALGGNRRLVPQQPRQQQPAAAVRQGTGPCRVLRCQVVHQGTGASLVLGTLRAPSCWQRQNRNTERLSGHLELTR